MIFFHVLQAGDSSYYHSLVEVKCQRKSGLYKKTIERGRDKESTLKIEQEIDIGQWIAVCAWKQKQGHI